MISELTKKEISYALATSNDAAAMIDFHNSFYGTGREPEDWLWEHKTYQPDKSVYVYAKLRGKLIAT